VIDSALTEVNKATTPRRGMPVGLLCSGKNRVLFPLHRSRVQQSDAVTSLSLAVLLAEITGVIVESDRALHSEIHRNWPSSATHAKPTE